MPARPVRLLGDAQAFLRDHPAWDGLALCGALVLPIVAILLFTPRLGVLAIPEVLVFAGMAGWLCCERPPRTRYRHHRFVRHIAEATPVLACTTPRRMM